MIVKEKIMIVKDKKNTETSILEIITERKKRTNVKNYTFEEVYKNGKNYIPKI